ncbi:DUF5305 family protein [Mycoplasmatota bacterium WC44]
MISMTKKKKLMLIIMLSFFVILFSILTITRLVSPKVAETEQTIYEYSFTGGLDYLVYLKSNEIYEKNYLESDMQYILQLTDFIDVTYELTYEATNSTDLSYNYHVYPAIESYTGNGDNSQLLWKKNYPNIKSIQEQVVKSSMSINDKVKLKLDNYIDFINEVNESLDINTNDYLVLYLEGNIFIEYDGRFATEEFTQSIKIPLKQKVYSINNDDEFETSDEFIYYNEESDSVNLIAIVGLIISLISLIASFKFINTLLPLSLKEKTFNKIFAEHSGRLVQLTNSTYELNELIFVREFNDLIKISDEISQPIFYNNKQTNEITTTQFLVFDNNKNYSYVLK